MVTKISKWSRIQDSCRIIPKIKPLVACAMPNIPSKFQKDPSITFWVILLTDRQTNRQTKTGKNITSLAEVIKLKKIKLLYSCLWEIHCRAADLHLPYGTHSVIYHLTQVNAPHFNPSQTGPVLDLPIDEFTCFGEKKGWVLLLTLLLVICRDGLPILGRSLI